MEDVRCSYCNSKYVKEGKAFSNSQECGIQYLCENCNKDFKVVTSRAQQIQGDRFMSVEGYQYQDDDRNVGKFYLDLYRDYSGNTIINQYLPDDSYWPSCREMVKLDRQEYPKYFSVRGFPAFVLNRDRRIIYYRCLGGKSLIDTHLSVDGSEMRSYNNYPHISYIQLFDDNLIKSALQNEAVRIISDSYYNEKIGKQAVSIKFGNDMTEVLFDDVVKWLFDVFPEWKIESQEWENEIEKERLSCLLQQKKASRGCYIATCVYGSYDCEEVWTLRRFRDEVLSATWYGRAFIRTYYALSPTLVKWFGKTAWFKILWKPLLDKIVANLNRCGVNNTHYVDMD